MVFIDHDESQTFHAYSFLRSLRASGSLIPVVLLLGDSVDEGSSIDGLPAIGYDATPADRFTSFLRKPYTKRGLCEVIRSVMLPHNKHADNHTTDALFVYNMLEPFLIEDDDSDL